MGKRLRFRFSNLGKSQTRPEWEGDGTAKELEVARAKRELARQRRELEKARQERKGTDMQNQQSPPRTCKHHRLTPNEQAALRKHSQRIESELTNCAEFIVAHGYGKCENGAGSVGDPVSRAENWIRVTLGKPDRSCVRYNCLSMRALLAFLAEGKPFTPATPSASPSQTREIQKVDTTVFARKDEIRTLVEREVARLIAEPATQAESELSPEDEAKIKQIKGIMTEWVTFKCSTNGYEAKDEDFSREYGKLYEKVALVREITIPRSADLEKKGDRIIRWLARGGHLDAALQLARKMFSLRGSS